MVYSAREGTSKEVGEDLLELSIELVTSQSSADID